MLPDYVGTRKPEINLDLQNIQLAMMTITEMDKIKEMAEAEEIRKGKAKHDTFYHCSTVTFYHVNGNFSEEIKQSNHFFRLLQYNFL